MTASDSLAASHRNWPFSRVGVSTNCSWLQYRQERAMSRHTALSIRLSDENVAAGTSGMTARRVMATIWSRRRAWPGLSICT